MHRNIPPPRGHPRIFLAFVPRAREGDRLDRLQPMIRQFPAIPALLCLALVTGMPRAATAVPVTVSPVAGQLIDLEVRAPATVVAANNATVTAQVTGLVSAIGADVGAVVQKGDLLIALDDADAKLALDRARADLVALDARIDQAEDRLRRGEELVDKNFISDDDLIDRRTTVAVLRANRHAQEVAVASAELNLRRTRITAPYAATVVARAAQVGSLAQPGTPLVSIVQLGNREVDADVDPRFAAGISTARELRLVSQGKSWPLSVARVSPVIDTASRIQKARFTFAGDPAPIGTSGEVTWQEGAALLPVPLIVQRDGRLGVFVAENNVARFIALPDAQEGRPAQSDLPADTLLVVRGQSRLQDGDALQVTPR